MTQQNEPPATRRLSRLAMAACTGLLVGLGVFGYALFSGLSKHLDRLGRRMQGLERQMQLYRFEQTGKGGLGMQALIEQIRFWAPQLDLASTPQVAMKGIRGRLGEVFSAMATIPTQEAFAALEQACAKAEPAKDDEIVLWLMRGMATLDHGRASDFISRIVEGIDFRVTPRLRLLASDILIGIDKARAGVLLRQILTRESAHGINPERVPPSVLARMTQGEGVFVPYAGFFNFIDRYVQTEDKEITHVLLMLIGRKEHDIQTVQECVKELGELGAEQALEPIEKLFFDPPNHQDNPIFRDHCLEAIAKILGPGKKACAFFDDALRREKRALVRNKLTELKKTHCR